MVSQIKSRFPIFQQHPGLVYLDNAATTHRPQAVIDAITNFYVADNSNIHRGMYELSANATTAYENTRRKTAAFLESDNPGTIAFTTGTTESINIVARSFVEKRLHPGDNIVITMMEHHANFIPWQMLAKARSAELRIVPINEKGDLDLREFGKLLDAKTKIVACTHISNTLGTVNDIAKIVDAAHKKDIPVLVDAAQSAALYALNVRELPYDFLAFSGHKMFGPFGTGVLYTADKYVADILPYNFGGGIIQDVTLEDTIFKKYPYHLDAGTPNVSGVMGLGAAIDFIKGMDTKQAMDHVNDLTTYCREQLLKIDEVKLVGWPKSQGGIISFLVRDIHPHDVASFLDKDHIAVRAGMHCTQPLLAFLETPATVRVSFSIYNQRADVDHLCDALRGLIKFWS